MPCFVVILNTVIHFFTTYVTFKWDDFRIFKTHFVEWLLTPHFSTITGHMKSLHWLPVKIRILFKLNVITSKAVNTGCPEYLNAYLQPFACGRVTYRS